MAPALQGLFNDANRVMLDGAVATLTIKNSVITEVQQLTLTQAGSLNANGATINALIVDADEVSLENLHVKGAVTLTNNVTEAFNVKNVEMGSFVTPENEKPLARVASLTNSYQVAAVSTRLKITFTDSTVAYVEIRQDNVYFAIGGSTVVESVRIAADQAVLESPVAVLPNLKIDKGVTQIELNASIANVVIETDNPVEIGGKGNFEEVVVNTDQEVKIATEGTIGKLESASANIELGGNVKVGATTNNGEAVDPAEVIKNIDEVKDNVNLDIKEEDKEPYFVAKPMVVKDKFGLITLSLTNAENATIKYEYVEQDKPILTAGQTVSANAKQYQVGQEINWWFLQDIHVYKVDGNNQVIESFRITRNQIPTSFAQMTLEGETLTIKTNFDSDVEFSYLYIADDEKFWMTEENLTLTKDNNNIPTLTVKVGNGISFDEMKTYIAHFGVDSTNISHSLVGQEYLGNYSAGDAVNVNLLKHFKTISKPAKNNYEGFTAWDYYHRLNSIINQLSNESYYNSYYEFALDQILSDLNDFTSVEAVKANIATIKQNLLPLVTQYNVASEALNNLYKDDRYSYPYLESLRDGITQQDINAVKALIEALPEKSDKQTLLNELQSAIYIFETKQSNANNTARLTFSSQSNVAFEETIAAEATKALAAQPMSVIANIRDTNPDISSEWTYN